MNLPRKCATGRPNLCPRCRCRPRPPSTPKTLVVVARTRVSKHRDGIMPQPVHAHGPRDDRGFHEEAAEFIVAQTRAAASAVGAECGAEALSRPTTRCETQSASARANDA